MRFSAVGDVPDVLAVSREHLLGPKERLTINDLYGETLLIGKRGDSACVDQVRDMVERYPAVEIEDTQQFYDIEVFNRCAQTRTVVLTQVLAGRSSRAGYAVLHVCFGSRGTLWIAICEKCGEGCFKVRVLGGAVD